jgi:hypothetical protein
LIWNERGSARSAYFCGSPTAQIIENHQIIAGDIPETMRLPGAPIGTHRYRKLVSLEPQAIIHFLKTAFA